MQPWMSLPVAKSLFASFFIRRVVDNKLVERPSSGNKQRSLVLLITFNFFNGVSVQ